jgi:hypothetical protein
VENKLDFEEWNLSFQGEKNDSNKNTKFRKERNNYE